MNVPRLAKWLSRLPRAQISKISLVYLSVQGDEQVQTWELGEVTPEALRSEKDLTAEILEAAQSDCDAREYQSRYSVRAIDAKGDTRSQQVAVCRPQGSTDPAGVGDPSLSGIVGQTLRHNEALMRMVVNSMSGILTAQHDILTMQAETIKAMQRRAKAAEENPADSVEQVAKAESMLKLADAVVEHVIPRIVDRFPWPGTPTGNPPPTA